MAVFSILKDGSAFIVAADDIKVIKCSSRRSALRLVAEARRLMGNDGLGMSTAMPAERPCPRTGRGKSFQFLGSHVVGYDL